MDRVVPAANAPAAPAFILDPESGLFSEAFLQAILPTRIATARRTLRPLGLVLIEVERGDEVTVPAGGADLGAAEVGAIVIKTLRDSDIAGRLEDGRIALLLEFTPVEGCVIVAERLQTILGRERPELRVWAGLSCYPAHAIDDGELLDTSSRALADARASGATAVVIAPVAG